MATATLNALSTLNTTASNDEADIFDLVETMLKANHDKDAAAFAAPFAPDAAVFNLSLIHI